MISIRSTTTVFAALFAISSLASCRDTLWPRENPLDQQRCDPACTGVELCHEGRCVDCVGTELAGQTCETLGFVGGELACGSDEAFDTTSCHNCGNNQVDGDEPCDGSNLGGRTCKTEGFDDGSLVCKAGCILDTSMCYGCGDGDINWPNEECDSTNLGGESCVSLGCASGTLTCSSSCKFDKSQCQACTCGNGAIDSGEECDGALLGGQTCETQGFDGGTLACQPDCEGYVTTGCHKCGDGVINGSEECDGTQLGGKTCVALGCEGGQLGCDSGCTFDKSKCTLCTCGNGAIDSDEECDKTNLDGKTCASFGYSGSGLACSASCAFDKSGCCGDGTIGGTEVCDGSALGGQTCASQGFDGGTLACKADCTAYVTTACHKCGDGVINGSEDCDGTLLGGETCATQGFDGGTFVCKSDCTFDTSGCYECGDGMINGPTEQCEGSQLGGETCVTQGFDYGTLLCDAACAFDTSGCAKLTWVAISKGTFSMGSPASEPCRGVDEDQHQVTLTNDFELSAHEVTQGDFQALMGYNPSYFSLCGTTCPLERVTWHEAAAFCNALSTEKGLASCYSCSGSGAGVTCGEASAYASANVYTCPGYRLPTDAEWEYAYRAGSQTAYYNGANDPALCYSCSTLDVNGEKIGWYCANSSYASQQVGKKQPNAWSLYDMAGNVAEWCHDWFQSSLGASAVTDPCGSPSGMPSRVVRGGSCYDHVLFMRAAMRYFYVPTALNESTGFRVARTLTP
jgi:formylglycine-generating enzyme required for sulfatase activity